MAPPGCQVEAQTKQKVKKVTFNKEVKVKLIPSEIKRSNRKYIKLKEKYARRRSKGFNKHGSMEEQQAELARLQARIQMDKANIVQEAIKVDHNESTADNLSFVLREFYHDSIREGVLNGSIPSGIADSGTTATCGTVRDAKHFLHTGETSDKIFQVANGEIEEATEVKQLPFQLRKEACRVDIVPGINTATLISTGKLADANYISIFDEEEVNVYDANNTVVTTTQGSVLRGYRDKNEGVYRIPLVKDVKNINTDTIIVNAPPSSLLHKQPPKHETINNVYELRTKEEIIRFYHAAAGYPTKRTWIRAVARGHYASWPGLTTTAIQRHFPESLETQKGHMRAQPAGIRSTKKHYVEAVKKLVEEEKSKDNGDDETIKPQKKQKDIYIKIIDTNEEEQWKIYTDQTGRFPRKSSRGNQYIMVLCEVDSNYIMVEPMMNRTAGEMVRVYQTLIDRLNSRGIYPKLQLLDNEISAEYENVITSNHITFQLVPPHNHRRNLAERAIQTFKAHFIAMLCGCDESFPIHLWCQLLPQVEMTLNMLRSSNTTPNVSSYAHLYGQHDYNAHPLTPIGVKVEMHVMPDVRKTYNPHSVSGYCIGTSLKHYRCYRIWVTDTRNVRVGNTVFFKHKYLTMPTITNADALLQAASDMSTALQGGVAQSLETRDAIAALMKIFKKNAEEAKLAEDAANPQRVRMQRAAEQRVALEKEHAAEQDRADRESSTSMRTARDENSQPTSVVVDDDEEEEEVVALEMEAAPLEVEYPINTTTNNNNNNNPSLNVISQDEADDAPANNTRSRRSSSPTSITQEAMLMSIDIMKSNKITPSKLAQRKFPLALLCVFAGAVLDSATGEMLEYRHLIKRPQYKDTWMNKSFGDEVGRLAQGRKQTGIEGTNTLFFINFEQIPRDRIKDITYDRICCNVRPEKDDPNRTRITVGGNNITKTIDCGTPTADLLTVKLLFNSIVSTPDAKFMSIDIKNFYLNTPMDRYEYMRMKLSNFPQDIIDEYNLMEKERNGYVYVEIRAGMYGLPAAGILAQRLLEKRLAKAGYHQSEYTPGYWTHEWRPISFTLIVDDFGVKYIGKEHAEHLLSTIKEHYECKADWDGGRYIGLTLDWDYENKEVHLSMPGYVAEALQRFQHPHPTRPQHQPHKHVVPTYGQKTQYETVDESAKLDKAGKTYIQQVTGTFLYYARAVDPTMLVALSAIASAQSNPTVETMEKCKLFMDYASTHPDAIITYRASEMVLAAHSDASYLIEPKARSRAGGHFFMSNNTTFPPNNGAVLNIAQIIKNVMTSAAEAEMGALYINAREAVHMRITLEEMGHPQPPTPMQTDNTTALGVITNNIRKKQSKAWDMRMYWLRERQVQKQFRFYWRAGPTNNADYETKHHAPSHHQNVRPEILTPVEILQAYRKRVGKELAVFTERERVC